MMRYCITDISPAISDPLMSICEWWPVDHWLYWYIFMVVEQWCVYGQRIEEKVTAHIFIQ